MGKINEGRCNLVKGDGGRGKRKGEGGGGVVSICRGGSGNDD